MSSEEKSKLLGLFFWIFTALNVVIVLAMGIFFMFFFGVIISQAPHKANDPPPEFFIGLFTVIFIVVSVFTVLFSVPKIIAGYGLRMRKPWARTWAIIASAMCCLSFPIGTAIGVFGLVFLLGDEGKNYFDELSHGRLNHRSSGPSLRPNNWR